MKFIENLTIRKDTSKDRLSTNQLSHLNNLGIHFSTNQINYMDGRKNFNDKAFTPIKKKPKNVIEQQTRGLFLNMVDHYPNTLTEISKVSNVRPIELFVQATHMNSKQPGFKKVDGGYVPAHRNSLLNQAGGASGKIDKKKKDNIDWAMLNVKQPPHKAAYTLFHELRHAQQDRGMTPITKWRPTDKTKSMKEWNNNPNEQDAERYAQQKVHEGARQATPPFTYDKYSKNMAVIGKTGVPVIDYPEKYNTVKTKVIVNMPPQKYFDILQKEILAKVEQKDPETAKRLRTETPEQFREGLGGMYESQIQEYMKKLEKNEDVPTGYILKSKTIDSKGKEHLNVEFDTPGGIEAARRLGIAQVPVVLASGRTTKYTGDSFWPEWEYSPTEQEAYRDEASRTSIKQIRKEDDDKANLFVIESTKLKKGAPHNSPYESDYEDDPSKEEWREVTTIDLSNKKDDDTPLETLDIPKDRIIKDKHSGNKWIKGKDYADYTGDTTRFKFKMVNPKELEPVEFDKNPGKIQTIVDSGPIREPIRAWNKFASKGEYTPPEGYSYTDKYQVMDGHHRLAAAIQRGDTEVPVKVLDNPKMTREWRERKGLMPDDTSGDMAKVYHGTDKLHAYWIAKEGIKTSNTLKSEGRMEPEQSDKTDPNKTYFFDNPEHAKSWAKVLSEQSGVPPAVIEADIPDEKLVPDFNMKFGKAYSHEGDVPVEKIKVLKDENRRILKDKSYNDITLPNPYPEGSINWQIRETINIATTPTMPISEDTGGSLNRRIIRDIKSKESLFQKSDEESTKGKEVYRSPYQKLSITKKQGVSPKQLPSVDDIGYFYDTAPKEYAEAVDTIELTGKRDPFLRGSVWAQAQYNPESKSNKIIVYPKKFLRRYRDEEKYGEFIGRSLDHPTDRTHTDSHLGVKGILLHETGHVIGVPFEEEWKEKFDIKTTPTTYPLEILKRKTRAASHWKDPDYAPTVYPQALEKAKASASREDLAESFALSHPGIGSYHPKRKEGDLESRKKFFEEKLGEGYQHGMTPREEYEEVYSPDTLIEEGLRDEALREQVETLPIHEEKDTPLETLPIPTEDNVTKDNQLYLDPRTTKASKSGLKREGFTPKGKAIVDQGMLLNTTTSSAYVSPIIYPKKTFIGPGMKGMDFNDPKNIKYLANVLGHEEMHTAIFDVYPRNKDKGLRTTIKYDNVVIPTVEKYGDTTYPKKELINPYSALATDPQAIKGLRHQTLTEDMPIIQANEKKYIDEDTKQLKDEWKRITEGENIPLETLPMPEKK